METKKRKCILYNISHYGYLSPVLLHSAIKNKENRNFLLIDSLGFSDETKEFVDEIKSIPFFENFIIYNEGQHYDDKDEKQSLKNCFVKLFDDSLNKFGIELEDVDEVYTGFDTSHAFGIYLAIKKKSHYIFDFNLITTRPMEVYIYLSGATNYAELICENNALTWDSPLVKGVIYTLGSSHEEIRKLLVESNSSMKNRPHAGDEKDNSFFTVKDNITMLTQNDLSKIREFFGIPDLGGREYDVLFLNGPHFAKAFYDRYRDVSTYEEAFMYPYRVLLDYLPITIANLAIKTHPKISIRAVMMEKMFLETLYIAGYIPSELFSLYNMKIKFSISAGSTSQFSITADKKIALPRSYLLDSNFENMNKIMAVIYLSDHLGLDNVYFSREIPTILTSYFSEIFHKSMTSTEKTKNVTVRYHANQLDVFGDCKNRQDINVFCMSQDVLDYFGKDNLFLLSIKKEQIDDGSIPNLSDEYLLIETKNEKYLKLIETYGKNIFMKYSGVMITHDIARPTDFDYHDDNVVDKNSVEFLAENGNLACQRILAIRYYRTKDVKLLKKAADYLRNVMNTGRVRESKNALVGVLMKINTEESLKEAYEVASLYAGKGDAVAMVMLARMYRDGKHVRTDLNEAAKWMRSAVEKSGSWSGELIGVLMKINTEESLKEAYEVASLYAGKGDAGAVKMLAKLHGTS